MYIENMKKIQVRRYKMQFTIKELRARKNETQEQTAAAVGVSKQTYNAWEKSISNVAVSKVNRLAQHFGVRLEDIFLN
jgi:DNA-binding XRE family transcriptional regulator